MNITSMRDSLTGKKQAPQAEESERRNDPWHAYRSRPVTARMIRRARHAEMVRVTKKYHAKVARAERDFNEVSATEAVRRVREWEVDNGPAIEAPAVQARLTVAGIKHRPLTSLETVEIADLLGLLEEKDEENSEAAR